MKRYLEPPLPLSEEGVHYCREKGISQKEYLLTYQRDVTKIVERLKNLLRSNDGGAVPIIFEKKKSLIERIIGEINT